jgi:hypothetical protein
MQNKILMIMLCNILLVSCGGGKRRNGRGASLTPIEQTFVDASQESGIPARLLMAGVYLESGLRQEKSSAFYINGGGVEYKPLSRGESSVGFSFSELGLNSDADLVTQIRAYGRLLKSKVGDLNFRNSAATLEEKINWIWALARAHRGRDAQPNLLAVTSRELIEVLNSGFSVQDETGVIARLEKENPAFREDDLPENFQQDLMLDVYNGDIRSAYLFSLIRNNPTSGVNVPTSVEVVHCPFALSVCIDLQNGQGTDSAPFGAHYIVPASDREVPGLLQFARHNETVSMVGADGAAERVTNRIIVMLAGGSGRYSLGYRVHADPMWLTDFQLRVFGVAIRQICESLASSYGVSRSECLSTSSSRGIRFRTQGVEKYKWGDIVDFDETIFLPYISEMDGLSGNTTLAVSPEGQIGAGVPFSLTANFQATTQRVEVERLVRCATEGQRVVWEPIDQQQVRNATSYTFSDNVWYDAGPNGTGDQFFRVKSTGDGGRFLGWSTKKIQLRDFERDQIPEAVSKYCLRNGT